MITVIKAGFLTTVQDLGRFGYQAWGMPVSGVVDFYAAKAANILVGNSPKAALLEMTLEGGTFHFGQGALVSLTGASANIMVNGKEIPPWSSFLVPAGGILQIGPMLTGQRMYLAVAGSIDVPIIMGSKSTYLPATLGGLEGRALQPGDMLFRSKEMRFHRTPVLVPSKWQLPYANTWCLNVTPGSQEELFSVKDRHKFLHSTYTVGAEVCRMSAQLNGPLLKPPPEELISEPTGLGAVEVDNSGKLLIVLPDHGTSRGFSKIAYVIHADFYKLAQMKLGDKVTFAQIDVETAADLYSLQDASLRALTEALDNNYI